MNRNAIALRGEASRRNFLRNTMGAAGAVVGAGLLQPAVAHVEEQAIQHESPLCDSPFPIPHMTVLPFPSAACPTGFHFFFPGKVEGVDANTGHNPSLITDFEGFIGNADLTFNGTGTDLKTGQSATYGFHTDTRFMKGKFVALDGGKVDAALAFI
jgi:hypothetical protein